MPLLSYKEEIVQEGGMKNKRYRELAAVLIMMTMAAGSVVTVAAEKNVETVETAEEVDEGKHFRDFVSGSDRPVCTTDFYR